MGVVLDQPFRAGVCLTNLALRAIGAEEPVVTQRSSVLLLRDPDQLGRLLLEAFEATRAHLHVRTQFQMVHSSSTISDYHQAVPTAAFSIARGAARSADLCVGDERI